VGGAESGCPKLTDCSMPAGSACQITGRDIGMTCNVRGHERELRLALLLQFVSVALLRIGLRKLWLRRP
jgi:hypothetical protein